MSFVGESFVRVADFVDSCSFDHGSGEGRGRGCRPDGTGLEHSGESGLLVDVIPWTITTHIAKYE